VAYHRLHRAFAVRVVVGFGVAIALEGRLVALPECAFESCSCGRTSSASGGHSRATFPLAMH
jgi:hypothetical protein